MSGTFQITLEVDNPEPLLHNSDKGSVKVALESLIIIGEVQVTRFPNNNGFYYFVTFIMEMGDLGAFSIGGAQLDVPNAKAWVVTIRYVEVPSYYGRTSIVMPQTTHTINGLTNGPYFFRVRAFNSEGWGVYCGISSAFCANGSSKLSHQCGRVSIGRLINYNFVGSTRE